MAPLAGAIADLGGSVALAVEVLALGDRATGSEGVERGYLVGIECSEGCRVVSPPEGPRLGRTSGSATSWGLVYSWRAFQRGWSLLMT
jgi:hypothetical protein